MNLLESFSGDNKIAKEKRKREWERKYNVFVSHKKKFSTRFSFYMRKRQSKKEEEI